jgi:hypothetical protein
MKGKLMSSENNFIAWECKWPSHSCSQAKMLMDSDTTVLAAG